MYKIYINDHPLCLLKSEEAELFREKGYEVFPYMGNKTVLLNVIDQLEKSNEEQKIGIYATDYKQLKSDFKSLFKKIQAMGGVIIDSENKVLFIYRRDRWDLPKGKKEKGEGKKECAMREVEEETGLSQLDLTHRIGKTRHTYRHPKSGKRVLKITFWYEMQVLEHEEVIVEEEEDIEDAKWMTIPSFLAGNYSTFANIKDILRQYKSMMMEQDGV
ncbi:NUDIX domain-containing protein [Membranicola marinus]|uniref:NUDIX domain-containing protein n=1 Tax=Membranihabitans marinus TaxID=1227546 RepID=A0A953I0A2_9BACT|nr:NUDIX domain-containing protein [Membranihabitans marinus]MBY5960016.1 NUDIX domain-containing protein [Membranihabitans marinus]